jgi:triosephosphate isomerase (TIM)
MKKIIVANWKSLPNTLAEAEDILAKLDERLSGAAKAPDIVICPPFNFIEDVAKRLQEGKLAEVAQLGGQDMTDNLVRLGVRYVIIGHSDRRWKLGESDETVNGKLKTALAAGLVPIVCLGERSREGGWQGELTAQTAATFSGVSADDIAKCLIAYEPVWAISTNLNARPDTPASAVQSMGLIRDFLADQFRVSQSTFLYGGSVTPANANDFLSRTEISGVLVGGASVRIQEFLAVINAATVLH